VATPRLFHLSEDAGIDRFMPKPVLVPSTRSTGEEWLNGPLVWAVDERRIATYYFPRECPRILLWPTEATNAEDLAAWWGNRECTMIAHVEWSWLEGIREQTLFRYELPSISFQPTSDDWMWVSKDPVEPIAIERMGDLLGALRDFGRGTQSHGESAATSNGLGVIPSCKRDTSAKCSRLAQAT
jgi:hypothetical protein